MMLARVLVVDVSSRLLQQPKLMARLVEAEAKLSRSEHLLAQEREKAQRWKQHAELEHAQLLSAHRAAQAELRAGRWSSDNTSPTFNTTVSKFGSNMGAMSKSSFRSTTQSGPRCLQADALGKSDQLAEHVVPTRVGRANAIEAAAKEECTGISRGHGFLANPLQGLGAYILSTHLVGAALSLLVLALYVQLRQGRKKWDQQRLALESRVLEAERREQCILASLRSKLENARTSADIAEDWVDAGEEVELEIDNECAGAASAEEAPPELADVAATHASEACDNMSVPLGGEHEADKCSAGEREYNLRSSASELNTDQVDFDSAGALPPSVDGNVAGANISSAQLQPMQSAPGPLRAVETLTVGLQHRCGLHKNALYLMNANEASPPSVLSSLPEPTAMPSLPDPMPVAFDPLGAVRRTEAPIVVWHCLSSESNLALANLGDARDGRHLEVSDGALTNGNEMHDDTMRMRTERSVMPPDESSIGSPGPDLPETEVCVETGVVTTVTSPSIDCDASIEVSMSSDLQPSATYSLHSNHSVSADSNVAFGYFHRAAHRSSCPPSRSPRVESHTCTDQDHIFANVDPESADGLRTHSHISLFDDLFQTSSLALVNDHSQADASPSRALEDASQPEYEYESPPEDEPNETIDLEDEESVLVLPLQTPSSANVFSPPNESKALAGCDEVSTTSCCTSCLPNAPSGQGEVSFATVHREPEYPLSFGIVENHF